MSHNNGFICKIFHARLRLCRQESSRRIIIQFPVRVKIRNAAVGQHKGNTIRFRFLIQRHFPNVIQNSFPILFVQRKILCQRTLAAICSPLCQCGTGFLIQIVCQIFHIGLRRKAAHAAGKSKLMIAQKREHIGPFHHIVQQADRVRPQVNTVAQHKHGIIVVETDFLQQAFPVLQTAVQVTDSINHKRKPPTNVKFNVGYSYCMRQRTEKQG